MNEPRPLPLGRTEFEAWSDRILSGAMIPHEADKAEEFRKSSLFTLCNMVLHLGPTESHKPDAYFIHSLRKSAANQVAVTMRDEIYAAKKPTEVEAKKEDVEEK